MLATALCGVCGAAVSAGAPDGHCTKCLLLLGLNPLAEPVASDNTDLAPILARPHVSLGVKFHRLGDYELIEEIARGGMGVVFRARQIRLNRPVALKLILGGRLASPTLVKRFQVEAEAAASLHHPGIVAVFETGECDEHHFYSMELVDGTGLDRVLTQYQMVAGNASKTGTRETDRQLQTAIARLMANVAHAVDYAHQRGVLHRDLKPSNILIDREGTPHLADFGLAKLMDEERTQFTLSGAVLGTPNYMAPELAAGHAGQATTAADIYSLGAILYELLTGAPPFHAPTPVEIWRRAAEEEARHPTTVNRAIDADLATICLRCLEKEPQRRYVSARALAEDLERWLADEPIAARPVGAGERLWRWCRRKPALAVLILIATCSLVAGFIGISTQWRRAEQRARESRLNLYAADMGLAQQAIREGNLGWARQLLDGHRPRKGEEDLRHFEWRLNRHLAQGEHVAALAAHSDVIRWINFSHDGKWLATASADHTVKIWEFDGLRLVTTLLGHTDGVTCVSFSRDDRLLASTSDDGWLKLWDTTTWAATNMLKASPTPRHVAFSPTESILAVSQGGDVTKSFGRVNLSNYEKHQHIAQLTNSGSRFAFTPDGKKIITGNDGPILAWETATGRVLWTNAHKGSAMSIAVSPDGKKFAKGSFTGIVSVFDVDAPERVVTLQGPASRVWCVAFSPDGARLAAASSDQNVYLWEAGATGRTKPTRTLRGQGTEVRTLAFSPDSRFLVTGDKEGKVLLWDVHRQPKGAAITNVLAAYSNPPPVFSRTSELLAALSDVNEVGVWNLRTLERIRTFHDTLAPLAFSEDGETLKALGPDGAFQWWSVRNGALQRASRFIRTNRLHVASLAPDGKTLAVGYFDGATAIWDVESGKELWQCKGHRSSIRELRFSPDGRYLATASWDFTAKLWDVVVRRELVTLAGHREGVFSVAFSPDGRTLATGSIDSTVRLWEVPSGKFLAVLAGHKEGVFRVAFTPDGETFATASDDRTVRLWNMATRREVARLDHIAPVTTVGFTPDHQAIVTTSLNGALNVWRAPSFAEIDTAMAAAVLPERFVQPNPSPDRH